MSACNQPDSPTLKGQAPAITPVAHRLSCTVALSDNVSRLRYVTEPRAAALDRLGIHTVTELLHHEPHRYYDFSHRVSIGYADVGSQVTVVGQVDRIKVKRPRPRLSIVELSVIDKTGVMLATFFKQPWVAEQVHEGDWIALSGKVSFAYGFRQMKAPFYEVLAATDNPENYARVLPVHPVGEGISVAWMRRIIAAALADMGDISDFAPACLVVSHDLMTEARALRERHFPHSLDGAGKARRRLAYDELLCLQLALLARRRLSQGDAAAFTHCITGPRLAALRAALPFTLTEEQERSVIEILSDMAAPHVMNRLLLGDVGTGKTIVAACALASAVDSNTQAAMMAPTSVLARQYAEKLGPLFDEVGIPWALLVGATDPDVRAQTTARLAEGMPMVVFGTTALLSEDVAFTRLSLVVIDEQHRFGVEQRAALRAKGPGCDLLAMTATPIPRTLALSIYGDFSLSRIAKRPHAGAGITTVSVTPENLDLAYGAIQDALAAGHQAYIVCPLIDESDAGSDIADDMVRDALQEQNGSASISNMHAATTTAKKLSEQVFPHARIDVLTGRMAAADKDRVMERFYAGTIDILVCTTVVEVGVDVPNATVMLIYDADRFGLATLHQLRGRVGRGTTAGTVYLETRARKGTPARKRLEALEATSDGMKLAQLDLDLRHEGDVLGYRQHGVRLKTVDFSADEDLIQAAHDDAVAIVTKDAELQSDEYRALRLEVRRRYASYFEEMEG